jgi:hypothetical protein
MLAGGAAVTGDCSHISSFDAAFSNVAARGACAAGVVRDS